MYWQTALCRQLPNTTKGPEFRLYLTQNPNPMKKVFPLLLVSLFAIPSFAQNALYHYPEEFYFVKEVSAAEFAGKNFRYEIAVKSDPADSLSKVRIHGVGVGKGPDDFLNGDFKVETRMEQEWTIYTVIGTVNAQATRLWFYAAVNGNGKFYFDDLSFYLEDYAGHWKQLPLFNHSFEEKSKNIFAGYYVSTRKSRSVRAELTDEIAKTGQYSLFVNTVNAQPVPGISTAQAK